MEDKNNNDKVAEGFSFNSKSDAEAAQLEKRKIDYIKTKVDYNNSQAVLKLYNKIIQERIFKTPVGIFFLKNLQDLLLKSNEIKQEDIAPIPFFYNIDGEIRKTQNPAQKRIVPSKKKEDKKNVLFISVVLNILLIIAVGIMFSIAVNTDEPNIINYRQTIVNQYSDWEQDLTKREEVVREKEKELMIDEE